MKPIVLTGPPGSGKTSLVSAFEAKGFPVFHEISREIIAREKEKEGALVPWKDHEGFHREVVKGRKQQLEEALAMQGPVFLDRGVPDGFGYLLAEGMVLTEETWLHLKDLPYHNQVFFTPPWETIFSKDAQRWEDFEQAKAIHKGLMEVYERLGFEIHVLPLVSVQERMEHILSVLQTGSPSSNL
jgi:predicted ATPase